MLRVGHIADAHLGKRQYNLEERERDVYDAFREAVALLGERGIDVLLLSGDIFDSSLPPIRALKVFRDAVSPLLDKGVRVFAISGDHDTPKRRDVPPIRLFDTMGVRYLWSGEACARVDDVEVCGLQNFPASRRGELVEYLSQLREREGYGILMLHQGLKPYFPYGEISVESLPRGFTYYAMGHIHKYIRKTYGGAPLVYPGSLEVIDVTEVEDAISGRKGPVLAVLGGEEVRVEKLTLRSIRPQVVVKGVTGGYRELLEAIEGELEKVASEKKPIVHVYVDELPSRRDEEALLGALGDRVLKLRFLRVPRRGEGGAVAEGLEDVDIHGILREMLGEGGVYELANDLLEVLGKRGDVEEGYSLVKHYYGKVLRSAGEAG